MKKFKRRNTEPDQKTYRKSHVPFRLNLLFFVIFALFTLLIVRLANLQIVNSDTYEQKIKASSTRSIKESTPRGMIYDASKNTLVENQPTAAISFTRGLDMQASDLLDIATKLNEMIAVDADDSLTERDLQDFWLADPDHLQAATDQLTTAEKQLGSSDQYQAIVSKVTEADIDFDAEQMLVATIFTRLNKAQQLSTVFVKNEGVTDREIAVIAEHAKELPGISTDMDWTRKVVTDSASLKSVLGTVQNGLRAENADEFLAKGYALDDRIGTSFLEKQYEEVLQGKKSEQQIKINYEGDIESQVEVDAGSKGENLVLSIDTEFQNKVDSIAKSVFQNLLTNNYATYSPGVYVVAMNPNTGAILAMSGYYHETDSDQIEENTIGVYKNSFVPGSVVKAATLTAGWETGVISGNQVLYDQPIYLEGSAAKASIFNPTGSNNQNLSAEQALEVSSNSYMMQIVLKMLGINYDGGKISMPYVANQKDAFAVLRKAMNAFGLGTETGIDLPDEETGIHTSVDDLSDANYDGGKILDLSFGQFDTYTPIQLAQYVSTVANGGKRMQPHLVAGIYGNDETGGLGDLVKEIEPTVLDEVDISEANMKILQNGFYDAVHGSNAFTTATALQSAQMDLAAKTGTAESTVTVDGKLIDVDNLNAVAYGPYADPEIAVAVMIPQLQGKNRGTPNLDIIKQVMDAYYDLYKK